MFQLVYPILGKTTFLMAHEQEIIPLTNDKGGYNLKKL